MTRLAVLLSVLCVFVPSSIAPAIERRGADWAAHCDALAIWQEVVRAHDPLADVSLPKLDTVCGVGRGRIWRGL